MGIISKITKRTEAEKIRASLQLPAKSTGHIAAARAWKDAVAGSTAARAEQQALQKKAARALADTEARLLRRRIADLQGRIGELSAAERTAKGTLDHYRAEHAAAIRKAVAPVADHFAAATLAAIDALADLLQVGAELDERIRAEDVNIIVPELAAAPAASRLLDRYVAGQFKRWRA